MNTDMDYIKFEESNFLQYLLTVTFLSHWQNDSLGWWWHFIREQKFWCSEGKFGECVHVTVREIGGTLLSTPEGNGRTNTATDGWFSGPSIDVNFPNSSFALLLASLCLYTTFSLPSLLKESFHGKVTGSRRHCQAWFRICSLTCSGLSPHHSLPPSHALFLLIKFSTSYLIS